MATPAETTYTQARAAFAAFCDQVTSTREPLIIRRRGGEDVALISAEELGGLLETAHLLRSPANAGRLLAAFASAQEGKGSPSSPRKLRAELGLDQD